MFTLILALLTEISKSLDLSDIDQNAFGNTLMNAVSLQLNLQGPTDKMTSYLRDLKQSIESQAFEGSQLSECEESLHSIEASSRDYALSIQESEQSLSTFSPLLMYAEDRVRSLKSEIDKQNVYLLQLKSGLEAKQQNYDQDISALKATLADIQVLSLIHI